MPRQLVRSFGTQLKFNGTSAFVDCGSHAALNVSVFTIAVWIKPISNGLSQSIRAGNNGTNQDPEFRIDAAGTLSLLRMNVQNLGTSTGKVTFGVWQHVAVTYDASGNYVFYINGVSAGSGTTLGSFLFGNFYIGTQLTNEWFNGNMDDFRIYNVVLNSTQIQAIYYGTNNTLTDTGLVGHWLFDEGSGTSATDSSGNSFTGSITAATYVTDPPLGITTRTTAVP